MVSQHQGQAVGLADYVGRRARLREAVFQPKQGTPPDALLIVQPPNLRYLTGFTGSSAMLVLTPTTEHIVVGGIYATQIADEVPDIPKTLIPTGTEPYQTLAQVVSEMGGIRRLGIESSQSLVALRQLRKFLRKEKIQVVPAGSPVEKLRLVKDEGEIRALRSAIAIADATFEHILRLFQPDITEWDIAMEIDFYMRRQGAYPAFQTIVASGPNSALPHAQPTERRLQAGDFVTVDFGARYEGYCSDITRTVVIGKATDEHRRVYNAVLEALQRSIEAIRPGRRGKQIDAIARKVLAKYQLADYFGHGLGHSIGITVHDGAGFSPREKGRLQAGMVVTVEPGVYIPGFGGVRIEQDVLVTDTGYEVLSRSPVELLELGAEFV